MAADNEKLTFSLGGKAAEVVRQIAKQDGVDEKEVLRRMMALYQTCKAAKAAGRRIMTVDEIDQGEDLILVE